MVVVVPSTEALESIWLTCREPKAQCLLVIRTHKLGLGNGSSYKFSRRVCSELIPVLEDSWDSPIIRRAHVGQCHHAPEMCTHMLSSGSVCLDGRTFVELLNSCAKLKHLERGIDLHFHAERLGLLKTNIFVASALVHMYCKCSVLNNAQHVFDQIQARNIVSWNALLAGYADNGDDRLALMSYEQLQVEGFSPNPVTYVCTLKACSITKDLEMGWRLHADIEQKGYRLVNKFVGSALVDMYVKCDMVPSAQQVFDKLTVRDVVTWTALMGGYLENGEAEKVLSCFEGMQIQGIRPNAFTFACSLRACSLMRDTKNIQEIHSELERMGLLEGNAHVVSVLLDAYGSFGFLMGAYETFERSRVRDVVAWTSLVVGLIDHGHAEEAIKCYDQMQCEGIAVDACLFVYILKACGLSKEISKGISTHSEIERRGLFGKDRVLGNTLLEMYAMFKMLNRVKETFDRLPIRGAIQWNLLMGAYWDCGQSEDILQCYCQMILESTFPDDVSILFCLKACSATNSIGIGAQLNVYIEENGFLEENDSIGGTLVTMYSKCGELGKAQRIFDHLFVHDLGSWNALISGHLSQACGKEALKCFAQMISEGTYPDEDTFIRTLNACGQSGNISRGLEIHAEIERNMLLECPYMATALIDMYCNCHSLVKAQETFNKLPCHNVAVWTVLLRGYADHGFVEEALKFFQLVQSEGVPFDACTSMHMSRRSESPAIQNMRPNINAKVERAEMASIGLTLVAKLLTLGDVAEAQQMFDNLPIQNIGSWCAFIAGYATHESSLNSFDQMLIEKIMPDCDTFVSGLKVCGYLRVLDRGYALHAEIEKRGFQGDLFVGSSLVDMYIRCGLLNTAKAVFDKLLVRDVVLWNVLLAGYVEYGHNQEALNLMSYMELEKISPSPPTLISTLQACVNMGVTDKAREIHVIIEKQGLQENDIFVGNSLIDAYAKCGLTSSAQKVFDKLPNRDITSWNSLMFGYKQQGNSKEVFCMFDMLVAGGVLPDPVTYVILLNACSRTSLVNRGEKYFDAMISCHEISPMLEHHLCMIDLLCRAGHLAKAVLLTKSIPSSQKSVAWRTILSACKDGGNLQKGQNAFDRALHLDEGDGAIYVLIAHIYASEESITGSHQTNIMGHL